MSPSCRTMKLLERLPPRTPKDQNPLVHIANEAGTHTLCGIEIVKKVDTEADCVVCCMLDDRPPA